MAARKLAPTFGSIAYRVERYGPLTIATVGLYKAGGSGPSRTILAWGWARCSKLDKYDFNRGESIAKGRARLALDYKLRGKDIPNHKKPWMA
jgi:hypothetical protein